MLDDVILSLILSWVAGLLLVVSLYMNVRYKEYTFQQFLKDNEFIMGLCIIEGVLILVIFTLGILKVIFTILGVDV